MKKIVWRLSTLAAIFCSLYAARHFFIGTAIEYALHRTTGETIAYISRSWEGDKLAYQGFSIGEQLHAEEATFDFGLQFFPFSLTAHLYLNAPAIHFDETEGKSINLAFLLPTKYWTVKLDVDGGNLVSSDGKPYTFDVVSGQAKEDVGRLFVYQEEATPLFTCGFNFLSDSLAIDFNMEEAPFSQTIPLASLFYPLHTWKALDGSASASIRASFDLGSVTAIEGRCSLQNLRWESDDLIFAIDEAVSKIDFQGDFESFTFDTDFKGADLFWKELEVLRAQGAVVFKPKELPVFEAHAAVHLADLEGRADLVGQGEIYNNNGLWLEGTLDYVTAQNPLKVDFSWADDGKSQVMQTKIHNLGKEILTLLSDKFSLLKIKQGILEGELTTFLDYFVFEKMQINTIKVHQLGIDELTFQEIEAQGTLNLISGEIELLTLKVDDIQGKLQGWNISSANAAVSIKENNFEPSSAFGKVEAIPFSLQLQGPLASFHASAKLAAGPSEWLQLPKNPDETPFILDLAIDRKEDEFQIVGILSSVEDSIQLQARGNFFAGLWKGGFQGPRLQSSFYAPLLKILAPSINLQGDISLRGQFSSSSIDIFAEGQDISARLPQLRISIPGKCREISYHYDFKQKQGAGKGKLSPLLLTSEQFPLEVAMTDGDLVFDENHLSCQKLAADIEGLDIQGDLTLYFEEEIEASFLSQKIQGSIENLCTAIAPFQAIPFQLKGRFASPPEGLQVHFTNGKFHYRFQALMKDLSGDLTSKLHLQNTACGLVFDSIANELTVQNLKGTLNNFPLSAQQIVYSDHTWDFDAAWAGSFSCKGQAIAAAHGYRVVLQEGKVSESYLKGPLSFHYAPPGKIDQLSGVIQIDAKNLSEQLRLLSESGLVEINPRVQETLNQLSGSMTLRLIQDCDKIEYELQGTDVQYASSLFHCVEAYFIQQGNEWTLERCLLDDFSLRGRAAYQNDQWTIPSLGIDWKELHLAATGIYEKEKFDFKVDGILSSRFVLKGKGSLFTSAFQHLFLQVYDREEKVAVLSCDQLKLQNGKWESPAVDLTVFSKYLSQPLQTKLLVTLSNTLTSFQGPVSQGEVKIGKSVLEIGQIFGLYEAGFLNLKCVASLDNEPLWFIGKFDNKLAGGVNIQKGEEMLKLSLSDPTTLQKAEGQLLGVSVNLEREAQGFKGELFLKESSKLADLLDNDNLCHLSGLKLTGIFGKGGFVGDLTGKDAAIHTYQFQELHAHVDYTPTRFRLRNVTVQDPAGSFEIKECLGVRTDAWNLSIPLLKGKDIKPSAVRRLDIPQKELKPLQIRYLMMTHVTGQLGDLKSFRGLGSLNFTHRVKKEPSIFDIPLTLLKDLGLDLDLFTPVMGEVDLQLTAGKLFFTAMQNAFSEGKRSEFYLAEEPSYIDLDGLLNLNLRMQQNVVLKLVEPFMITVRGTWEKPKYSLR
jgi:hypothetical protein